MESKKRIRGFIDDAASELHTFILKRQCTEPEGWVAAAEIKKMLELDLPAGPKSGGQGQRGWLFATLARLLEDKGQLQHKKGTNGRSFYKAV